MKNLSSLEQDLNSRSLDHTPFFKITFIFHVKNRLFIKDDYRFKVSILY